MEEVKDYSSPFDNLFDVFFAEGVMLNEQGRAAERVAMGAHRTFSYAKRDAGNLKFDRKYTLSNIAGAYTFKWDKEAGGYVITRENQRLAADLLRYYGWDCIEPEEG